MATKAEKSAAVAVAADEMPDVEMDETEDGAVDTEMTVAMDTPGVGAGGSVSLADRLGALMVSVRTTQATGSFTPEQEKEWFELDGEIRGRHGTSGTSGSGADKPAPTSTTSG